MLNVAVVAEPVKVASLGDFTILIELAKVIGFPALLFYLIYLTLKYDREKWEKSMNQHKEERDRDSEHLRELMEAIHGQMQAMAMLNSGWESMNRKIDALGEPLKSLPTAFRDIHARFDNLPLYVHKENHVGNARPQRPPLEGKDGSRPA
jgi:hypothetical protein